MVDDVVEWPPLALFVPFLSQMSLAIRPKDKKERLADCLTLMLLKVY